VVWYDAHGWSWCLGTESPGSLAVGDDLPRGKNIGSSPIFGSACVSVLMQDFGHNHMIEQIISWLCQIEYLSPRMRGVGRRAARSRYRNTGTVWNLCLPQLVREFARQVLGACDLIPYSRSSGEVASAKNGFNASHPCEATKLSSGAHH
jgi:hypothetical protein